MTAAAPRPLALSLSGEVSAMRLGSTVASVMVVVSIGLGVARAEESAEGLS